MRRFVVRQNIARFEHMLRGATNAKDRDKLHAFLEESRRELALLVNVWTWTCPHLDITDASGAKAEQLLDEISRRLGAKIASLQIWDEDERAFYLVAHQFDETSAKKFAVMREGDGSVSEAVLKSQEPVIVDDFDRHDGVAHLRDWARSVDIRSVHTTPLFGPSRKFLGTFSTHYTKPREMSERERELNAQYAGRFSALFAAVRRK